MNNIQVVAIQWQVLSKSWQSAKGCQREGGLTRAKIFGGFYEKYVREEQFLEPTNDKACFDQIQQLDQSGSPTHLDWIGLDWRTWLQLDLLCYILADLVSSSPSNNQMSCGWSFQASPQCKAECLAWPQATFGVERSICWSLMLCLTIFWKLHILCLKLWNW